MQPHRFLRAVFLIVLVGALRIPVRAGPPQAPPASPDSPPFREFTKLVQQYVKLQKSAPRLKTTKQPEKILDHRQARAQKIRETRSDAKQGDIFTPEASDEFRRVIRSTMQGPNARKVRTTIRQGEPQPDLHLTVNGEYPERLPFTTVPPTLLRRLPQLPSGVAYRIIGHDFVLEDTEARLIVDFIPGAVP